MQRGRGGRDDFFGGYRDPFAGFPGFGRRPGSLISSFFNGRDPFDDPFFTKPFGSMMGPSIFGPSMFESSGISPTNNSGFLEQQASLHPNNSKRPIIEEILSDEDDEGNEEAKKDDQRKNSRSSKEPYVDDPDEDVAERSTSVQHRSDFNRAAPTRPHGQTYSFQSSTVTYGGPNGAYYTASSTKRMGGDGVVMEESKEADSTTGKASHRISRGIHDKGHTLTRKLNSDGRVDSLQTLHNLNEDELSGFDEAWKGKARQHLPGWNEGYDMLNGSTSGSRNSRMDNQRARALPSTNQRSTPNPRKSQSQLQ